MEKRVVLTGLTPSAENLHIGNYIGSLRGLVKLQNDENNRMILFCSDLHALTNPTLTLNFAKVKESFVATYVAAGIDLEKTLLFYQSDVHTHAELG
jgi:tryptophanyl-tRNA synthetase